ncbi:MAG: GNAT family N-acetyltransferase [Granulosicoccus sp.]
MNVDIQVEVRDSLDDVPEDQWNALCHSDNPFLRHEFLQTLDDTDCLRERTGWYPRYFLLWAGEKDPDSLLAAVPCYIKTNSYGEFVFDWSWADAYQRHNMEYYPKLVSSIPFTPATGRRILVRADQPFAETVKLMLSAVSQYTNAEELSSAHFLFVTEEESDILSSTTLAPSADGKEEAAMNEINRVFLRRLDCQYHWHNNDYTCFDDFLAQCSSKRRKTIRRERRHVTDAGLRLEQRSGETLSREEWQWVHQFYRSTFDRKWGNPSLTRRFFETVGRKMGANMLIVFAYDPQDEEPERPVACSIMFVGGGRLYGRFWGCRKEYNSLHFEACYYQGIEYCIANNIGIFEPGAQGEHKITRGFVPTLTYSSHYIRHKGFRNAIAEFLEQETPYVRQRCDGLADLLPFKNGPLNL